MKHTTNINEDGSVTLTLGLNKQATFAEDASPDDVINGVVDLVNRVTGVNSFLLVEDVIKEFFADEERKQQEAQGEDVGE